MNSRQATGRWAVRVFTAGIAAWFGLVSAPARGQQAGTNAERPARVYAGGSALITSQPGTSLGSTSDTPLEGTGLSVSGLFGAGGRVSVEGQVTSGPGLNGLITIPTSSGDVTYTSTFRDTLVSAFIRWRGAPPSSRVLLEPVGGVTMAFGSGVNTHAFVPDPGGIPEQVAEQELKRRSLGFGGGLDLLVPLGRRVAVGGLFRVHRLVWNEEHMLGAPEAGLGLWVYQAGAGVRVDLTGSTATAGRAPASSAADSGRRRGYLGGVAGLFVQPVGEVDGHYLTEGVGGNGVGFGGTAGAFIHPHWSVAAEVAVGPEFEAESIFAGRIRFNTRYRDTLMSGLFRWHPSPSGPVQVEPVFGATVAAGHAPRTETWLDFSGGGEEPTDATITRVSFGAVGGADLVAGRRVAAVASFRLHVLDRNDVRDDQPPELGVGRFVYIIAGGIRYTF
ncbi:MAG: hypothetical protein EHM24_11365 [Acidobacteria bacterium]|nr:MAG: hypothetical protein EHM24_11365 [Acidobacteriota bacterium]